MTTITGVSQSRIKMTWYANLTTNRDYPPRPLPEVVHLSPCKMSPDDVDVTDIDAFEQFVAGHSIGGVMVYDSRFPQREMTPEKFEKHARKIWK